MPEAIFTVWARHLLPDAPPGTTILYGLPLELVHCRIAGQPTPPSD